jgi:hypothetical protein
MPAAAMSEGVCRSVSRRRHAFATVLNAYPKRLHFDNRLISAGRKLSPPPMYELGSELYRTQYCTCATPLSNQSFLTMQQTIKGPVPSKSAIRQPVTSIRRVAVVKAQAQASVSASPKLNTKRSEEVSYPSLLDFGFLCWALSTAKRHFACHPHHPQHRDHIAMRILTRSFNCDRPFRSLRRRRVCSPAASTRQCGRSSLLAASPSSLSVSRMPIAGTSTTTSTLTTSAAGGPPLSATPMMRSMLPSSSRLRRAPASVPRASSR